MDPVGGLPQLETEVRRVGAFQLEGYRAMRPELVQVKKDASGETSAVTRWDIESETMLREWLQRQFPGHSFLGEESGNQRRDASHYWLVDPIDGTSNFTRGIPFWGISVGYWRDGVAQLGIVYFPALDQMFTAVRGGGAFQDGRPIRCSEAREYSMLNSVALDSRTHLWHALRLRTKVRILGSAIANQCYTARGTFVACRVRGRLWDIGAGLLLLQEAGAMVDTDPDVGGIDLQAYAADGAPALRLTLDARANVDLQPLRQFLEPVPPPA